MVVKKISFEFLKCSSSRVMRSSWTSVAIRRRRGGARGGDSTAPPPQPPSRPVVRGGGWRAGGAGRSAGRGVDEVVGEVGLFGAVDLATVVSV